MYNIIMIILVGASASGKTEIAKKLISNHDFSKVVTYTTREKRVGEKAGVDYHFISTERFLSLKDKKHFLETTYYNNNYYGTTYDQIGLNKVLIIDPAGLKIYKELNDPSIVSFFIDVPEHIRKERMIKRGDDLKIIEERLILDREQFSFTNLGTTDFVIEYNDQALTELAIDINTKYLSKVKL